MQGLARCHFVGKPLAPTADAPPAGKIVIARRPTAKTRALTRGHVKWLVIKALRGASASGTAIAAAIAGDAKVSAALQKHFGTAEDCARLCFRA